MLVGRKLSLAVAFGCAIFLGPVAFGTTANNYKTERFIDLADPQLAIFENHKTELYLDRTSAQSGSPILISPYAADKDSLKWTITSNLTVNGWSLYAFAGVEPGNYISVLDGDTGLVVGTDPALFAAREIKPLTFSFTYAPIAYAITAPNKAGEQVTLQPYNTSNVAQHWSLIYV